MNNTPTQNPSTSPKKWNDSVHCISRVLTSKDFNVTGDTGLGICFGDYLSLPLTADDDDQVHFRIAFSKVLVGKSHINEIFRVGVVLKSKQLSHTVQLQTLRVQGILLTSSDSPFLSLSLSQTSKYKYIDKLYLRLKSFENIRIVITYLKVGTEGIQHLIKKLSLNDEVASDVTLRADGKEFKLHKCILAARSDVFEAMFNSDMKEKNEGIVNIADVNSDVLEMMIKFIYNDHVDDMHSATEEVLEDLLFLADRYNIAALKKKCERHLIPELGKDNCLRLLNAAIKINAQDLQTAAKDVLSCNLLDLLHTEEYKQFVKDNFEHSLDVTSVALNNSTLILS